MVHAHLCIKRNLDLSTGLCGCAVGPETNIDMHGHQCGLGYLPGWTDQELNNNSINTCYVSSCPPHFSMFPAATSSNTAAACSR